MYLGHCTGIIPRIAMSCQLEIQDLGKMAYEPALALQRSIQQRVISSRDTNEASPFHLLFVEHDPPVITVSRRGAAKEHLLATEKELEAKGIQLCETDRGGDITYHGQGQLVGYLICDLNALSLRLHSYMRFLEDTIINSLRHFGIEGQRDACATGVWVGDEKICAMGVRISRWVSMHGFALNVVPNMEHFKLIVPCGLSGRRVTSMQQLLGKDCPSMEEVQKIVGAEFLAAINHQAQVQQEHHP
jgi:lipoate-protein ligase B